MIGDIIDNLNSLCYQSKKKYKSFYKIDLNEKKLQYIL